MNEPEATNQQTTECRALRKQEVSRRRRIRDLEQNVVYAAVTWFTNRSNRSKTNLEYAVDHLLKARKG